MDFQSLMSSKFWRSFTALALTLTMLAVAIPSSHGAPSKKEEFSRYLPIEPPLVVNLANATRAQFLQVKAELYVDTPADAELLHHNMPLVRDRLILYFSGREVSEIQAVTERESLRLGAIERVRETMLEATGRAAVSGIYFTSFIVQ